MKKKPLSSYYVGILKGITMTECNFACSDLKEATKVATAQNKNVYQLQNGFYLLKKKLHESNKLVGVSDGL